ncbi:MAG: hypothetical protein Q4D89_04485 [Arachnia propionica]|uniref:hypothetical protein n=1 Tax=Arachnia propionica TaxID=1750 RepID=UPI002702D185|nr:hypothetical protein [Arachnia propionica]
MTEAVLLARALTGEELPVTSTEPTGLVAELVALGWDSARIGEVRAARRRERLPWPFPVDHHEVREVGFARFDARLAELRQRLGVDAEVRLTHVSDRPLNADERRLVAERPPHWG